MFYTVVRHTDSGYDNNYRDYPYLKPLYSIGFFLLCHFDCVKSFDSKRIFLDENQVVHIDTARSDSLEYNVGSGGLVRTRLVRSTMEL